MTSSSWKLGGRFMVACVVMSALLGISLPAFADHHRPDPEPGGDTDHCCPEHGDLGQVGAKLANPLSDLWSIQFNLQGPTFYDGDLNSGDPEVGTSLIFQPVLPLPLYGKGEKEWRLITRPVLPILFAQPVPRGGGDSVTLGGLGDMELPLLLSVPWASFGAPKSLIFAVGPNFYFPTATRAEFGTRQYGVGPAVALGWKTKLFTAVVFPSYFWSIGERDNRLDSTPDLSRLDMLYSFIVNLPHAWQVGLNPTISYNHRAPEGDQWNVPIGIFGAKTIKVGRTPLNLRAGLEYSVVSEDSFGKRANFRFQITPVVASLIKKPIFGGGD